MAHVPPTSATVSRPCGKTAALFATTMRMADMMEKRFFMSIGGEVRIESDWKVLSY
jgi:hypothetical protein